MPSTKSRLTVKSRRPSALKGAVVLPAALLLTLAPARLLGADSTAGRWTIPGYPAPAGEAGGALSAEFERRDGGGGDEIQTRTAVFKLGWVSESEVAVWGEGGVGALAIVSGASTFTGDFGAFVGVGAGVAGSNRAVMGMHPFLLGRAYQFHSRLGDDREIMPATVQSRRSKFRWQVATVYAGLLRPGRRMTFAVAAAGKYLEQVEWRSTRTNAVVDARKFTYNSGLEPGLAVRLDWSVGRRWGAGVGAEVFDGSARIGAHFGQWGVPFKVTP